MSNKMFIIAADTSGSMAEYSKMHLLRHLCRYVQQRSRYTSDMREYRLVFLSWGRAVQPVAPLQDDTVPLPDPAARRDEQSLLAYLRELRSRGECPGCVLLLTDDELMADSELRCYLSDSCIPASQIIIGEENEQPKMRAGHLATWAPEDICTAVSELLYQPMQPVTLPANLAELHACPGFAKHSDDEDDDWIN